MSDFEVKTMDNLLIW